MVTEIKRTSTSNTTEHVCIICIKLQFLRNTKINLDEHKTLTKNSRTISQRSPTLRNALCTTRETGKTTVHNLVENPEALVFHQKQMETTENSTK